MQSSTGWLMKYMLLLAAAAIMAVAPACDGNDEKAKADQEPGPEIAFVKSCNWLGKEKGRLLLLKKPEDKNPVTLGEAFAGYPGFKKTQWGLIEKEGRKAVIATGLVNTREEVAGIIKGLMNQGNDFLNQSQEKPADMDKIGQDRINRMLEKILKMNCEFSVVMVFALNPEGDKARLTFFTGVMTDPENRWAHMERKMVNYNLTLENLHRNIAHSKLEKLLAEAVLFIKEP